MSEHRLELRRALMNAILRLISTLEDESYIATDATGNETAIVNMTMKARRVCEDLIGSVGEDEATTFNLQISHYDKYGNHIGFTPLEGIRLEYALARIEQEAQLDKNASLVIALRRREA